MEKKLMNDNDLIRRGDVRKEFEKTFDMQDLYLPAHLLDVVEGIPAAPQEMSAREYLKMREQMASELGELCSECHCDGRCWDCPYHVPDTEDEMKNPDRSVAIVEKWAREHPEERSE